MELSQLILTLNRAKEINGSKEVFVSYKGMVIEIDNIITKEDNEDTLLIKIK